MQVLNEHLEGRSSFYETDHRLRAKPGDWVWIDVLGQVITRVPRVSRSKKTIRNFPGIFQSDFFQPTQCNLQLGFFIKWSRPIGSGVIQGSG
jgi:hypothetical protein